MEIKRRMYYMKDVTLYSIILTLMYFLSGIKKIISYDKVVKDLEKKIVNSSIISKMIIGIVIILEIICPILIVTGTIMNTNEYYKRIGIISTYILIWFTMLATYLYHFPPVKRHYYPFMSNVTAIGGLLLMSRSMN